VSICGTLRYLQVYPKYVAGVKCEGTCVYATSADKRVMFLLHSIKEPRRLYGILRGTDKTKFSQSLTLLGSCDPT